MNSKEKRYEAFALVREMLETPDVIRNIDRAKLEKLAPALKKFDRYLLSGEGSSRIFPAKRTIAEALRRGDTKLPFTEGATQALEYKLDGTLSFIASNSGKTREGVRLLRKLKSEGKKSFGLVANAGTPIVEEADFGFVLSCGEEKAVAATKSVVEQALVYHLLFSEISGCGTPDLNALADAVEKALTSQPPQEVVDALVNGKSFFWAGRNDGVAEELTLKTNEIARKRSDFLEGTYAVHGIEEVMDASDTVILVEPFADEEEKIKKTLAEGVGCNVVAIASRQTSFPTFVVPQLEGGDEYVQLAAGWNLLAETGISLGIDLDHPVRARKVGNEMVEG